LKKSFCKILRRSLDPSINGVNMFFIIFDANFRLLRRVALANVGSKIEFCQTVRFLTNIWVLTKSCIFTKLLIFWQTLGTHGFRKFGFLDKKLDFLRRLERFHENLDYWKESKFWPTQIGKWVFSKKKPVHPEKSFHKKHKNKLKSKL